MKVGNKQCLSCLQNRKKTDIMGGKSVSEIQKGSNVSTDCETRREVRMKEKADKEKRERENDVKLRENRCNFTGSFRLLGKVIVTYPPPDTKVDG